MVDIGRHTWGGSAKSKLHPFPPGLAKGPQEDAIIAVVVGEIARVLPACFPTPTLPMTARGATRFCWDRHRAGIAPAIMG
jgi:hypothetical protein